VTHFDALGNALSTHDPAVVAAINQFSSAYLGYSSAVGDILGVVDAYPDEPLLNAYAAVLWMFLEAPEAPERAGPYLGRAIAARARANRREQLMIDTVSAWLAQDWPTLDRLAEAAILDAPGDLVLSKVHQYHAFNRGDGPAMLRLAKAGVVHHRDNPHALAALAFGYEQCHLIDAAEAVARRSLEIMPTEPWAQHAIAHICLSTGRMAEGLAFLEARKGQWRTLNSFMVTHLWWHLALFLISAGRLAEALALYDYQVWGVEKGYSQDQIGAVSLLARLEMAGCNVGDRWNELSPYLAARKGDVVLPFLTVQYLLGLAKADRPEADQLLAALADEASRTGSLPVWRHVALPVGQAMVAFARGDFTGSYERLRSALPMLADVGGSHAQRDLFELIALDAAIKSGHWRSAQQQLELRRKLDPDGVPLNQALAQVYRALGLAEEAAVAERRYTPHSGAGMPR
jgi:tetratricopeptide (TPR) repeat protein